MAHESHGDNLSVPHITCQTRRLIADVVSGRNKQSSTAYTQTAIALTIINLLAKQLNFFFDALFHEQHHTTLTYFIGTSLAVFAISISLFRPMSYHRLDRTIPTLDSGLHSNRHDCFVIPFGFFI